MYNSDQTYRKSYGRSECLPQVFSVQTRRGEECSNYEHAAKGISVQKVVRNDGYKHIERESMFRSIEKKRV